MYIRTKLINTSNYEVYFSASSISGGVNYIVKNLSDDSERAYCSFKETCNAIGL